MQVGKPGRDAQYVKREFVQLEALGVHVHVSPHPCFVIGQFAETRAL